LLNFHIHFFTYENEQNANYKFTTINSRFVTFILTFYLYIVRNYL
jgi:hypothetical protein